MRMKLMAIALLAIAAASPTPARAQSQPMDGSYTFAAEGSDDQKQVIDAAVAKMNFVIRPLARRRLRNANPPYRGLRITSTANEITTIPDSGVPVTSPSDGTPVLWTRETGEKMHVSTEWQAGTLEQTFRADDGQRVNRFSLSPDGGVLTMHVTVTSPRLPRPLTYALRYRRQ
ncbi:MAG: hypothetical protein KY464_02480 [Gemmatimonadetes bacterium]|nr:hypothetical protein [Gemmatimonadota bacterium]